MYSDKKHFRKHLQLKTTMINFSVGKVGEKIEKNRSKRFYIN